MTSCRVTTTIWWHVVHTIEQQDGGVRLEGGSRRPASRTPGFFAPHGGRGLGRCQEGDAHLRGPWRPLADAPPRGTAPIARAYLEHGLHREPQPQKLYTIGPMGATTAPAAGATASTGSSRSRRSAPTTRRSTRRSSSSTLELLRRLGVTEWMLHLNSIGDAACRPAYSSGSRRGSTSTTPSSTPTRAGSAPCRRFASST